MTQLNCLFRFSQIEASALALSSAANTIRIYHHQVNAPDR